MARVCAEPGCPKLTEGKAIRCPEHEAERRRKWEGVSSPRSRAQSEKYKRRQREYDRIRGNRHQRGYGSKWAQASAKYLEENPHCVRCGARAEHTDHIVPHQGDLDLFWSRSNWQALCHTCHNRKTREDEARARSDPRPRKWGRKGGTPCGD